MAKSKTKLRKSGRGNEKTIPAKKAPKIFAKKKRTAPPTSAGRRKSKADQIQALLKHPGGATLKAIMSATSWQAHSVRGFISGYLVTKMKLRVKSFRRDGERVYAIKN